MKTSYNVVIPAKNEAENLKKLLPALLINTPPDNIIVVNDGSEDDTQAICLSHGINLINHPYSMGNGSAIKTGARCAKKDIIVFMDADGQHNPDDIPRLLEKFNEGYEMVVGARQSHAHASFARRVANSFYNRFASFMTSYKIEDLTSGFRAVRARHFRKFLYLLPNGFSYPTTSTMAFFRSGFPVAYVPIVAGKRTGKSHINVLGDGFRFFLIILKIGALFSPMRLFLPISFALFGIGCGYYTYTYSVWSRFTNMSALLILASIFIFLMGIISEHISALHYRDINQDQRRTRRE